MPLSPGRNYSYDVGFQPQPSVPDAAVLQPTDVTPSKTLGTLGLLADGTVNGRPHKALGYVANAAARLRAAADRAHGPADAARQLPPARASSTTATEGKKSFDGLAWVDDLIDEWRRGTAQRRRSTRPHQLFLTGDQIYADDVDRADAAACSTGSAAR